MYVYICIPLRQRIHGRSAVETMRADHCADQRHGAVRRIDKTIGCYHYVYVTISYICLSRSLNVTTTHIMYLSLSLSISVSLSLYNVYIYIYIHIIYIYMHMLQIGTISALGFRV